MKSWKVISKVLCCCLLALTGCSSGLQQVEGVVVMNDEPVAGATVTFFSEDGTGRPGNAFTDQEGKFKSLLLVESGIAKACVIEGQIVFNKAFTASCTFSDCIAS